MVSQEQSDLKKMLQIMLPRDLHLYVEIGMKMLSKPIALKNMECKKHFQTRTLDNCYNDLIFDAPKYNNYERVRLMVPPLSSFKYDI